MPDVNVQPVLLLLGAGFLVVNARLILVLIGIAVSLTGIMGILNRAFQKNAIWRK